MFLDTVWICALTAFVTLLVGYPLALCAGALEERCAQVGDARHHRHPLFLGEVVRTYSWIIVLGNNGFINSLLRGPA